ncbi:hypothetical protein JCM10213_007700 [Rhodosporidiobolus nylandii]
MAAGIEVGTIVWLAVKPLIRVLLIVGIGFILQKTQIIPPAGGSRILANVQIKFALPCLLFAKIVPSFTPDNASAIGPIILTGFFYQALPAVLGIIARAFTQTPRRFRYGLIAAYCFGNWGDLPFSMVASVAASAPFNGESDEDLGSAYVAIFILVNYLSMFPLQGMRLCSLDYSRGTSASLERQYEDNEFGASRKWANRFYRGKAMRFEVEEERRRYREEVEGEQGDDKTLKDSDGEGKYAKEGAKKRAAARPRMASVGTQTPLDDEEAGADAILAVPLNPPSPSADFPVLEPTPSNLDSLCSHPPPSSGAPPGPAKRVLLSIWSFFRPLVTSPPTVALFSALVISLVPALRALFVAPASSASFHPTAPDGDPPLAVLYDTASFVGGASVPLGLTVLGASMAQLKIPKPIGRLPIKSIVAMAVIRMVLTPVVGFFFVKRLVESGMVGEGQHVLRFVLTLLSCVPTATTQVAYSQLFAPPGVESNADLLAAYLIMQYIFWAVANVVLTAVTLNNIF